MTDSDQTSDVATLTVQLLSAYLANNTVPSEGLADLIRTTRAALTEGGADADAAAEPETFTPAVSVRKSLASSQHIISLIDGRPYKTLKRHLASHGLTPDSYRSRYNLPASYPMVAPDYAANRREVARRIGLGSRRAPGGEAVQEALPEEALASAAMDQDQPKAAGTAAKGRPATSRKKAASAEKADATMTTDESTDASADNLGVTSTKKRGAAKSRQPAGAKTTGRKSRNDADAAQAEATGSEASAASEPAGATETKRRGRGAAKKADAGADLSSATDSESETGSPAKRTRAAAKPKKDKRMARPSSTETKADADADAGSTAGSGDQG